MTERLPKAVSEPPAARGPDAAVIAIAAALLATSAVVAYEGWRVSARKVVYGLGPGTVPYFVAACLAILAAGTLIAGLKGTFPERDRDEAAPVLWIVGGLIAQLAFLKIAGFSIATGLLFAATAKGMGRGPLWMTVPVGIALSFVIWVIFTQLLNLSLPVGPPEAAFLSAKAAIGAPSGPAPPPSPAAGAARTPAPAPAPARSG